MGGYLVLAALWLGGKAWSYNVWVWQRWSDVLRRAFTPVDRFGTRDPAIEKLSGLRGTLGVVLVGAAQVRWGDPWAWVDGSLGRWQAALFQSLLVGGIGMLLPAVLLLTKALPGKRHELMTNLRRPSTRVALVAVSFGVLVVLMELFPAGRLNQASGSHASQFVAALAQLVVFWTLGLIVFATLLVGGRLVITHWFCAVDGHPMLRGLTEIVVSFVVLVLGLLAIGRGETGLVGPTPVATSIVLVGPLIAGLIAAWELRRLRSCGWRLDSVDRVDRVDR